MSLNEELTEVYSFGRKNPKNPVFAGFVKEDINTGVYDLFKQTECQVYSMKVSQDSYDKIKDQIEHFNLNKENYHYSLFGILTAAVNIPLERENSYFCSQFVSHILKNSDIQLFDIPCGLVRPSHFINAPNLTLKYEGKLSEYPFHSKNFNALIHMNHAYI